MFRDDTQAFRAIRLLLARLGLEGLWTDAGPTKGALLLRDEHDAPLSPEKRTLLLAAWSLWSPVAAGVALGDVLHRLDRGSCLALCSLIVAYTSGADAVDAWIDAASVPASVSAPPAPPVVEPPPAVPPAITAAESAPPARSLFADWPTLDVLSVRYVDCVLGHVHENKSEAARVLGVDWRTVSRLVTAAHEARRRSTPR